MDSRQFDGGELHPQGLRGFAARLYAASKPGEQVFLLLGQRLDEAVKVINHLTAGLGELSELVDGQQVEDSAEGLRQAARRVVEIVSGLAAEGAELNQLAESLAGGSLAIGHLRKTVGEVAILGINAKIQVAQIYGANTDFAIFTSEIARLAALADGGLEKLEHGYNAVATLIEKARHGHAEFARTHGQALSQVAERLQSSLVLLERHHEKTHSVVIAICRRSAEIAILIGEAVVSLQANDITRQRIEHVAEALEKAAGVLSDATSNLPQDERLQLVAIICRLQSHQLVKTADQFEGEVKRLLTSLSSLASDADAMLNQEISLGGRGNEDSLFVHLQSELDEAKRLYHRFDDERAGTRNLIGQVASSVGQMIGHVQAVHDIEADIRVMGLNATLKCTRLGNDGRALAVIAQELRQCANRTQDQAEAVGDRLQRLVTAAEATGKSQDAAGAADSTGSVIGAMTQSLGYLLETQDVFEGKLPTMVGDAERAKALLTEAASRTDIHETLGRELRETAKELDRLAAAHTTGDDDRELARRALTLLDGQYTMASERDIHALFLGEESAPSAAPAEVTEVDDFLF